MLSASHAAVRGRPPGKAKAALSGLRRVAAAPCPKGHRNEQGEWGARIQSMALGELFPAADPRTFAALEDCMSLLGIGR